MSRMITLTALAVAFSGSVALAGGPVQVSPESVVIEPAKAGSGLGTAALIGGVVLAAVALGMNGDDSASSTTTTD